MMTNRFHVVLTEKALPLDRPSFASDGATGAAVDFYGVVRGREEAGPIAALDYEAYLAMAQRSLEKIVEKLGQEHGAVAVRVTHRTGTVPVGEPSLHVHVETPHRGEAFKLAEAIISAIKRDVPIWKKARA